MKSIEQYYNNTQSENPRENVSYFINEIKCNPSNAIELGSGAGNDTVYLIKNNWNVCAIDREDVEGRITNRLNKQELERLSFKKQEFENLKLEKSNLIVANYCLPFCNKDKFKELWDKIKESISPNGYFVGNFFGVNDSWNGMKDQMVFLSNTQVKELFYDFDVVRFKEIEKDGLTGLGMIKHWHIFDVIAKRK